jgi:5-formyltetrahydrofolate cyclo-ligase
VTKAELRLQLHAALRTAEAKQQRAAASEKICASVRQHPAWAKAKLISAFLPLPSEPQIAPLWAGQDPARFCFPRVVGDDVGVIQIIEPELLRRATWKLDEAGFHTAPLIPVEDIDLFLVPALGFTAAGRRLGRGGGWYDRLLPRRRPGSTALGLGFALQIRAELPWEPHDHELDGVITENGLLGKRG